MIMKSANKLVIKPSLFRSGKPRLGITKNWVTNNHWVVHKSLIADPLLWLTQETAMAWLNLNLKSTKHLGEDLDMNDDAITDLLNTWKTKGSIKLAPKPLDGIYMHCSRTRIKAFPMKGTDKLFCVQTMYCKALAQHLTHMLYHSAENGPKDYEAFSLCNHDATVVLRPFRSVSRDRLKKIGD